ncbi:endonuclease domain-containing protein [Aquimarina sp. 2-A2]|uniref:endonuclease domain-containing protein n=1 Tax=Aquimarina sp. 2-A2 TaxID=3382644 RepID=UPI00387EFE3F
MKKTHDKPELKTFRKDLRQNLTSAEAFLWKELQQRNLEGRKFRRQHSIENLIVDFYCAKEQLVIELDGDIHMNSSAEEKDEKRNKKLRTLGLTILRFENKMIFHHLSSVLQEIKDHFSVHATPQKNES